MFPTASTPAHTGTGTAANKTYFTSIVFRNRAWLTRNLKFNFTGSAEHDTQASIWASVGVGFKLQVSEPFSSCQSEFRNTVKAASKSTKPEHDCGLILEKILSARTAQ